MATLQSPGVAVTVIDESFYTPAEPGTTPLIVVATAENKRNGSGTGTALATTKAQAGKAFRVTSQRDLVDLFGVPFFEKTPSGSPIHAGERNEYGLLAAYSFLGVSNSAFIVRADVDLTQLEGQSSEPGSEPKPNQWWFNTRGTTWGIQEWDARLKSSGGQVFVSKEPIVLTDSDTTKLTNGKPRDSIGAPGDYAVVARSNQDSAFFYKNYENEWTLIGSPEWRQSHPTVMTSAPTVGVTAGDAFTLNGVDIVVPDIAGPVANRIAGIAAVINNLRDQGTLKGVSAREVRGSLHIYIDGDIDSGEDSSLGNAVVIQPKDGANPGTILSNTELNVQGAFFGPVLQVSPHTQVPQFKRLDFTTDPNPVSMPAGRPSGSVWIKTTEPNNGARWRINRWNANTKIWESIDAPIYKNGESAIANLDRTGGGLNIPVGSLYVQYNSTEDTGYDSTPKAANFKIFRRSSAGATVVISTVITADSFSEGPTTILIKESRRSFADLSEPATVSFDATGSAADADLLSEAINGAGLQFVRADKTENNEVIITHSLGGEIRFYDVSGVISSVFSSSRNIYEAPVNASADYIASNWQPLAATTFIASNSAPTEEPADGQLWYNPEFSEVDIMIHSGTTWVGYRSPASPFGVDESRRNVAPAVSASDPFREGITQNGDLWISTADLENFPTIYRWNGDSVEWDLIDKTDQTTEDGILFADARWTTTGGTKNAPYPAASITDLLTSDYLDPDAPDPALYPRGMMLWNLRRSGGNVKRYANNYIDTTKENPRFNNSEQMANYATDRWVTASANQEDGAGTFGRKAQHSVVVAALKSVVDTSAEIRDEERRNFNLIACPGYPELLSNLVNLNLDRGITSFVVGDTPFRLASDATTLTNWGTNANGALDNNEDGIVTFDEYAAVFYPQGFTTDLSGTNAVVPASHMMLRTIALSDQVSYPWFAPAGTRRGGITNATAVGYIDSLTGEFQTVSLNEGQRDVLYDLKVNPITFFVGAGLVNYGQKTRGRNASALDRINVSRLTVYLRSQLNKLARPYVFEPNDKITRDEIKSSVESLLLELVSLRAIYDFAVVCDESNNTPSRIDRNELYVDVAIEPVKAVEFIYIPLRVKNTGEI